MGRVPDGISYERGGSHERGNPFIIFTVVHLHCDGGRRRRLQITPVRPFSFRRSAFWRGLATSKIAAAVTLSMRNNQKMCNP